MLFAQILRRTDVFSQDFILILIPVGPPALTLAAVSKDTNNAYPRLTYGPFQIVEMSDAGEETQAAVAKTILISYIITPVISLSVSAALTTVKLLY